MHALDARRRSSSFRRRSSRLRIALALSGAVALAWLAPRALRPGARGDGAPRASAQARHVPRALDITPLGTFGGPINHVAVDGTQAYVVRGAALESYDGRDPANLVFQGRVTVPGADVGGTVVVRVVAGGDRVGVLLTDKAAANPALQWQLFDAQPGRLPAFAGSYVVDDVPASLFRDAVIGAGYLYNLVEFGLSIVDISDAARPIVVYVDDTASAMALRDRWLFVGVIRYSGGAYFKRVAVYDVLDPAHPVLLAEREVEEGLTIRFESLLLYRDRILSCTIDYTRPSPLRVSVLSADPPTLAPIGQLDVDIYPNRAHHLTVFGDRLAVVVPDSRQGGNVSTYDLRSLPAALPEGKGTFPTTADSAALAALGNSLLVADRAGGLLTLGADPATDALTRRGVVDTLGAPYGLVADGRTVHTMDNDGEVWALDVPSSGEIEAVGHAGLGLPASDRISWRIGGSLTRAGDRLVASRADPGSESGNLVVIDAADPVRPRPLGAWSPGDSPPRIYRLWGLSPYGPLAIGSRLLVAGRLGPIELNLDDPAQPRVARTFDPDCRAGDGPRDFVAGCVGRGLAVDSSGERVFLARGTAGVQAFDVAPGGPSDPVETIATGGDPFDVAVTDQAVFVANGPSGLHVADRHSPRTADLTGLFAAYRIALDGDTAYLVGPALPADPHNQWYSVWAVDVTDPFAPTVRGHAELHRDGLPAFDVDTPPHVLRVGDLLLATIPYRGIAVFRLGDGRPLPAARLILPSVLVAR